MQRSAGVESILRSLCSPLALTDGEPDSERDASPMSPSEDVEPLELEVSMQVDSIVLATDLSEESKRAFVPTAVLARELGMHLVLLHVVLDVLPDLNGPPLAEPIPLPTVQSDPKRARRELEELAQYLGGDEQPIVITGSDIVESISSYAKFIDACFIAISTHGGSGFRRLALGHVADGLMRRSKTPIVCFPRS
jgi:nucleotide-binding universal stress UspA family protein